MQVHVLRLRPGADLLSELTKFALLNDLHAACIVTCVGSLTKATLRFANKSESTELTGPYEICSLVGTLGVDSNPHLHVSLSTGIGVMVGGHVMEGCIVHTTAEIVIGECSDLTFRRPIDPQTTYDELVAEKRNK